MNDRAQTLAADWQRRFEDVMEAMADVRPAMEVAPDRAVAPQPAMLWWRQNFDAGPGSAVWIGAGAAAWETLGRSILAAAGMESAEESEIRGTYLEVLRQSLSALATSIGGNLGREVLSTDGSEEEPSGSFRCAVGLRIGDQALPDLVFCASEELLAMLPRADQADQVNQPAPQQPEDDALELSPRARGTLNLLLDVEMPVSVSFGRTEVRIQEVLRLITGSIIELDRAISEPVEVIVNNCVVARGEVVVVDGNYGVRIQEVMSRRERLQESRKYLLPVGRA